MNKKKVAILGAGASGLISTKICLENDLEPVCFEMTSDIGGLWNYSTALVHQKGSVMKSTIINSSKENMAFSDYPAPKDFPNFMHNKKLLEYFRMYAKEFDLYSHMKFNTKVNKIEKADDYESTGRWFVTYTERGENTKKELFDAVMICNGHHAMPNIPVIRGLNDAGATFKGEVVHSWEYRDPFKYIDKRVLVIGVGNSGGDIAVELSRIASQVYLSTRSGMWVSPRSKGGYPSDFMILRRVNARIAQLSPNLKRAFTRKHMTFDHDLYCVRPATDAEHHIFVNDDIANRIASGTLIIKPNFKEFTANSCIFDDGTVVKDIDVVILSTGYKIGFPLFESDVINVKDNWVNLYKYVFPPQLKHGTLAVMGCIQPIGSINPIVELQARWVARVIKGELHLPSKQEMECDIAAKAENVRKRYYESSRHTIQVDFLPFVDEIASLVGCMPNLTKYFFTDNELWRHSVFGPMTPYQYRLNGHGSNYAKARELILTTRERVEAPFKTRTIKRDKENKPIWMNVMIIFILIAIIFKWFF